MYDVLLEAFETLQEENKNLKKELEQIKDTIQEIKILTLSNSMQSAEKLLNSIDTSK